MKTINKLIQIAMMFTLIAPFSACKKDKPLVHIDIMQHYIAGKFTYQQGTPLPFALIPISTTKATFVWVGAKREVNYTFENNRFTTNINGEEFSCDIINGATQNIVVNSTALGIPVAVLNKKEDAELALAGKRFEAPLNRLDNGAVVFDNYYFRFIADATKFNYTSNPLPGNYLIITKNYENLADGCFYDQEEIAFGVMLNNKLEIEAKIGDNYTLFSGTKK